MNLRFFLSVNILTPSEPVLKTHMHRLFEIRLNAVMQLESHKIGIAFDLQIITLCPLFLDNVYIFQLPSYKYNYPVSRGKSDLNKIADSSLIVKFRI